MKPLGWLLALWLVIGPGAIAGSLAQAADEAERVIFWRKANGFTGSAFSTDAKAWESEAGSSRELANLLMDALRKSISGELDSGQLESILAVSEQIAESIDLEFGGAA